MERDTTELTAPAPLSIRSLRLARLAGDPAVRMGLGVTALCLAIVLVAGVGAWTLLGPVARHGGVDPPGYVDHLGGIRDALAAPFARWDSVWYVLISHYGYAPGPSTAFFPAYPGLVHAAAVLGGGYVIGGVVVSLAALVMGLVLLWRLTEAELGGEAADFAVLAAGLFPMAFFFTAVYSESLFLALTVGAFWMARNDRWAWAGVLGAGAAATRSGGALIAVGLLALHVQRHGRRPTWALAWLALVPAGVGAYMGWLAAIGLDPLSPLHAQVSWYRHFAGPFGGVLDGARAAWDGVRQLASGQVHHVYFRRAGGDPMINGWHNVVLFAFLLAAVPALIGIWRRLPKAYGVYTVAALALPLSYPVTPQPLMSLPRFLAVLFPIYMWAGAWLAAHRTARMPVLAASAGGLVLGTAEFATWHWVA